MTLQSSGQITLANIATEFGGATPHSLSEYYRGGAYTTSNNTNVPTSGQISIGNFYGAQLGSFYSPLGFSGGSYSDGDSFANNVHLDSYANGTWQVNGSSAGVLASGNWWTPTTAGIGASKYIKWTVDAVLQSLGGGNYASSSGGWTTISDGVGPWVSSSAGGPGTHRRQVRYLVEYGYDGANTQVSGYITMMSNAVYDI